MIRLRGEDTAQAIRDWVRSEVARGPASRHELGRFLFGVSSSTIGVLVGLEKFSACPRLDAALRLSLLLLLVSSVVALVLAIPKRRSVGGESDLLVLHDQYLRWISRLAWSWFVIWLAGLAIGVWAVVA